MAKTYSNNDNEFEIVKLRGKAMYAKFFTLDTKFEPKWVADVLLDDEGKKFAQQHTLRVKNNPKYVGLFEGYDGSYVRVERPQWDNTKKEDRQPPEVKDSKLRLVPSTTGIGNGSDILVRILIKKKNKKGAVLSPSEALAEFGGYGNFMTSVQVKNLVPYDRGLNPEVDFVEEDGDYEVGGHAASKANLDDEMPF